MQFFNKMKISMKLSLGFGFILLLTLLISLVAIDSLRSSVSAADKVHELVDKNYSLLDDCQTFNNEITANLAFYLSPGNQTKEAKAKLEDNIAKSVEFFDRVDRETDGTKYEQEVDRAVHYYKLTINNYKESIVPLIEAGKPFDALAFYLDQMQPASTKTLHSLGRVSSQLMAHITSEVDVLRDSAALIAVVVCLIIALSLGALASFILSSYISKRIHNLCAVADAISNNDLTVAIPQTSQDEFGTLEKTMRMMRDNLSSTVTKVIEVSENLKVEIRSMSESSSEVVDAAKNAESQSVTVAAAADEMVSTTADIAKNCESAAAESSESRTIAMNGMDDVRMAVDQIREQSQRTNEDAEKIQALADQSQKIGSIVGTIDEIAAQTNLLALNAAIEAARAGEAGRGFAVVADEVRALASRTTKSTQEISSMVSQIQNDAHVATQSMESSVANMNSVAEKAGTLEGTLTSVLDKVNAVNAQITQIATAAEEQTTATSEISANMQGITASTQTVCDKSDSQIEVTERSVEAIRALQTELSLFKVK